MVCPICNGRTKANQPCRRHTCKFAPRCHTHTKVAVRGSNIAGRGLFARDDIRAGEIVGDYTIGTDRLTPAQFRAKYPSGRATHVWAPRECGCVLRREGWFEIGGRHGESSAFGWKE